MVNVKNVLLLGAAVSGLVIERDVNTILTNLKSIDTATNKFTTDTKAWDGTAGGSITVQNDYKDIDNKVKSATSEANGESQKSSADSTTIINYVVSPLANDIKAALDALTGRKADVAKAGLTSLAKSDLTTLKTDTDALGQALIKIASSDKKAAGSSISSKIDTYFNSAIAVFS